MVVPAGEVVYDSDLDKYFLGDGITLGGNEILGARYDAADGSITFDKLSQQVNSILALRLTRPSILGLGAAEPWPLT